MVITFKNSGNPDRRGYKGALSSQLILCHFCPGNEWVFTYDSANFPLYARVYTPVDKMTGEVEDKLNELLKELYPRQDMIHRLLEIADVEIQVTYYGYKDQMWGLNFEKDVVKKIADLNISVDIDL